MNTSIMRAVLCGLAVQMLAPSVWADAGVLTVGTEGDAPMYSMADAQGHVTGYDADVANAVCAQMKVQCKFVVQSFSTLIPSLSSNRFDVLISGLGITEARREKIDFSIPYGSSPQYFVVAKGSPALAATNVEQIVKALSGKTVGVVNGTTYARYVAKHVPDADIKTYDSVEQLLGDLQAGRLDAGYSDSATWADFFKSSGGANFARVEVMIRSSDDPATLGFGMGVGVRKGNTELTAKVDKALCTLINDGTLTKVSQKWFQEDYTLPCKP